MSLKPFVKWSGSKRSQADEIIAYFPKQIEVYYEPFLGGGAILGSLRPQKAVASDINEPLIRLWEKLRQYPKKVSDEYRERWNSFQEEGYTYFYKVRDKFNREQSPLDLLFITRTCVNGLIRYNKNGEFNNSLHHTRKGIHPNRLNEIILEWADIIREYKFLALDYKRATCYARKGDFIYLDPPYFNTGERYFGSIDYDKFIEYIADLNERKINFALSYDGERGSKSYIVKIPQKLYKRHVLLHSGNSTFNKVQNKKVESVYESLYLNY